MFLRYFKSSFFIQYFVIGVTGLLLWLPAFIRPFPMPRADGPVILYDILYSLLASVPVLSTALAFCLVCYESWWLNLLLCENELLPKNSSLSSLVFLVLMSYLPEQLTLSPVNISIFFLIVLLNQLLKLYRHPDHYDRAFAAGFFTAIAGMFYLPILFWYGFVFVSFFLFRSDRWREWIASAIGMVTPFIYLATWYFWKDELPARAEGFVNFFHHLLQYPNPFHTDFLVFSAIIVLLTFWGLYRIFGGPSDKKAEIKSKTNLFLWMIPWTILTFAYSRSLAGLHPQLATPALTLIITGGLFTLKKTRLMEILLMVLYVAILANNIFFPAYPGQ